MASTEQAALARTSDVKPLAPVEAAQVEAILAAHAGSEGALLPILHAVQEAFGYVPAAAVPSIAEALNLSKAEVIGVISFYHDFRQSPAGRHVLKLCRAEACQAMGARGLAERALRHLGIAWGGTTANSALTVEPVYCLGLCAVAPAGLLDGEPVGRLDATALDALCARTNAA